MVGSIACFEHTFPNSIKLYAKTLPRRQGKINPLLPCTELGTRGANVGFEGGAQRDDFATAKTDVAAQTAMGLRIWHWRRSACGAHLHRVRFLGLPTSIATKKIPPLLPFGTNALDQVETPRSQNAIATTGTARQPGCHDSESKRDLTT